MASTQHSPFLDAAIVICIEILVFAPKLLHQSNPMSQVTRILDAIQQADPKTADHGHRDENGRP